jgi:integrative and conjugative element protein (TIGR02256 family)
MPYEYTKVSTTRNNVRFIDKTIEIEEFHKDILGSLKDDAARDELFRADVVINATASRHVSSALEFYLRQWPKHHPPIASMAVGHRADTAVMTLAQSEVPGIVHDLDRRLKIAFANSPSGEPFLDEFWPDHAALNRLFQPEPGCSAPTFVGSAADMAILSARMLNVLSEWLDEGYSNYARGFGMRVLQRPNVVAIVPHEAEFRWTADEVSDDLQRGYQIRLSPTAKAQMLTWMKKSERNCGRDVETGGILFGQIDDFLKVVWVTEASGPPPESTASRHGFVCGTRGVASMNAELAARTRGAVSFIGMWHTHPGSIPCPSPTDRAAMHKLLGSPDFGGRQFLMLIVGGYAATPTIAGSLFKRDE